VGDFTLRPRRWLVRWMPTRCRKRRAVDEVLRAVIVEPLLAWLETRDDRMAGLVIVRGRMLARRCVAAADVPALRTTPEVQPPTACGQALDATVSTRPDSRINSRGLMCHRYG